MIGKAIPLRWAEKVMREAFRAMDPEQKLEFLNWCVGEIIREGKPESGETK